MRTNSRATADLSTVPPVRTNIDRKGAEKTMPEDRIDIKNLLTRGVIGVHDWERNVKQDIVINLSLFADLAAAGRSDNIDDTVNYRTVAKEVIAHVESSSRLTVEALAADVAKICLSQSGVIRCRVRVEKPGAIRFADAVGVEIERKAGDLA